MNLLDAAATIMQKLDDALSAATPAIQLVGTGQEPQRDGEDGASVSHAFADVEWDSNSSTGPDPTLQGSCILELHLVPNESEPLYHHEVAQALRGTLEKVTLAVYGTATGTPGVLQGALLLRDFRWTLLQPGADEIICQADLNILER